VTGPVLSAEAPAKVNRELRVGRHRTDGYHEIRSRLVSIDLSDRLEVSPSDGALELLCEGLPVPGDDSNLVVRAARALAERLGRPADVRIRLDKRIPVGAGLGGGSSDAATTLVLLSRFWNSGLAAAELAGIAASLGSDVPFFLVGGEAEVSGRGERVRALADSPSVELLLAVPPYSIATARVYEGFDRSTPDLADRRLPTSLDIETSGRFFGPNDLAFAVLQERGEMSTLLDSARSLASEAAITGSGSAIVLRGAVPEARRRLGDRHPDVRLLDCRTISRADYERRGASSGGSQWRSRR
jgi:4-diphosphocytidyl-2C-methyl-D-erythritol kinase